MTIVATIEARMTSSRLPGKVLMPAGGRPLLRILIERLQHVSAIDSIVVATTTNATDDPVAALCEAAGVAVFRGSEDDVLGRVRGALDYAKADIAVEITGDCPLIDPRVIDRVVRAKLDGESDYVSNTMRYTYPEGLDTEVFSVSALERAWRGSDRPCRRGG